MKKQIKLGMLIVATFMAFMFSANAAVVGITGVTGHHTGQRFGYPVGNLPNMIDGSGMLIPDSNDPSTWTASGSAWQNEWQSNSLLSGATNSKIGWVVIDLGSATADLDNLYIWNERENLGRTTDSYNLYYASAPTIPPAPNPGTQNTLIGDYDFASGGWTQLGSTASMSSRFDVGEANIANDVIGLGRITAQFIGIEILSNRGDANRVGIAEIAVTTVPEPSSTALLGLGALALLLRRHK